MNARVEECVYWKNAVEIIGEEVELMDPPMKRWNRYLKAKQQPNEHPTQWIERVNQFGKTCNYKMINPEVLRMLIIYIGLLEGKLKEEISKDITDFPKDLSEKTVGKEYKRLTESIIPKKSQILQQTRRRL